MQIHTNRVREGGTEKNEGSRTINDPVTFPLVVLAYGTEQQAFLAERIASRWWWSRDFVFLVFIVNDAPRAVDETLDL